MASNQAVMAETLGMAAAADLAVPIDDGDLVARHRAGDPSAFDELVVRHQHRVAALAHRLLGWPDDVDDVVQDVFLAALKGLPRFDGRSRLTTWLTAITVNACRSRQRRRASWLRRLAGVRGTREPEAWNVAPPPQGEFEAGDEVRRAVQSLPGKYREVVVLRYLEELSVREVAEALGVPTNTVEVRLSRARERLRIRLASLMRRDER
jgi:RNA polymerase sigma-70 factor (ECF subfamily)